MKKQMTSSIESDRFKAKCASGSTYIVIEKTKESTESRVLNEQTLVTTRKSYFLSTGEKVNKLTEKDYLIINEKKTITRKKIAFRKSFIADIKTIFDYLKNQALCIAMALAIPEIHKVLAKNYSSPLLIRLTAATAASMAIVFSVYNLIWFYSSLEDKPKLKPHHIFAIMFTFALAAAAMAVAALKTYQELTI